MAYIAPSETFWKIECTIDSQRLDVTFYMTNETETSSDDVANAIRNALDNLTGATINDAKKNGVTSSSF